MKKNATVLIGVTLIIIIVVIFYTTKVVKNSPKSVTEYDFLVSYDFENNYPNTPNDIIQLNNKILKCMYNNKNSDEQLENLMMVQRNLFAEKLKELNSEQTQFQALKEEIETLQKDEITFMGTKDNPPEYDEETTSICNIKSLIYMTKGGNIYRTYTIIKQNNNDTKHWKIFSWEDAENDFVEVG